MILFFVIFPNKCVNVPHSLSRNVKTGQESKNFSGFYSCKTPLSSLAYAVYDSQFTTSNLTNILNYKLSNYNKCMDIVNNLWYQKLFISRFNKLNSQYYGQMYNLDFQNQKLRYKTLISHFSRVLKNEPICSFNKSEIRNQKSIKDYDIEYRWSSMFYKMIVSIKNTYDRFGEIYHMSKSIPNSILYGDLPLYVISNHLGQIMVAEMPNASNQYNFIDLSKENTYTRSQIWFFMNIQDAQEYLNAISKEQPITNTYKRLKIFTSNLATFYRFKNKYYHRAIFRIVPDLNDLAFLMTKYKNSKSLNFHPAQNHGKVYFQGQPIYFIEIQSNDNQKKHYHKTWNKNGVSSIPVFMNYQDAKLEQSKWEKTRQAYSSIYYSRIIVYNLEKFLETVAQTQESDNVKYTIIPSKTSYLYMKNQSLDNLYYKKYMSVLDRISSINFWLKRIFWSLTSKNPIEG